MIFSDQTIIDRMSTRITPFTSEQVRVREIPGERSTRVVSYGVSGSGYDLRLSPHIRRQGDVWFIDPKNYEYPPWNDELVKADSFVLMSGECVLGVTIEHIDMPDDVMALCIGKSTYARCGLLVNATPIEAGWRGHITLELSNTGRLPILIYPNEGIAQLVFMPIDRRPNVTYNDRGGKYQDQESVPVTAKI